MKYQIFEFQLNQGLEFIIDGLEGWEDFKLIVDILVKEYKCVIIEKYDWPYARYCSFVLDGLKFKLVNDPDFGNTFSLLEQSDIDNKRLRAFANDFVTYIQTKLLYD